MLSESYIEFKNVWKKYSKRQIFHRSVREDFKSIFATKAIDKGLSDDEFWALREISFKVRAGECIGLTGVNGSGKTTLLKLISNVTYPNLGGVDVYGRVAPMLEVGPGFHPDLTGLENIYMNGTILGMSITEIRSQEKNIIEFSEIENFIRVPVKKYSSGMLLRLGFSIAAHSNADIFLFDEVFSVADQKFRDKCKCILLNLKKSGKIIFLVNHNPENYDLEPDRLLKLNCGCLI